MDNPSGRRLTVIYNPVAGNRRRALLDATVEALNRDGWTVSVIGTTAPGNATDLARDAVRAGTDVIVAAGGDGTIGEVAAGMSGSGIPLGIIPMGTANVLAVEFALPRRPRDIASTFASGLRRQLHLPEIGGRPFLLMVGAGFDGEVVKSVTTPLKRRLGKAAFVLKGLRAWLAGPSAKMTVTVDGAARRAQWAVVTNIVHYGGPYRLAPQADAATPELTAFLFHRAGRLRLPLHLFRLGLGIADRGRGVTVAKGAEIVMSAAAGAVVPYQVDGDDAGRLPCRIAATGDFVDILAPSGRKPEIALTRTSIADCAPPRHVAD